MPVPKPANPRIRISSPKLPNPISPTFRTAQKPNLQININDSHLRTPNYELRTAINPQTQFRITLKRDDNTVSSLISTIRPIWQSEIDNRQCKTPKPKTPHVILATKTAFIDQYSRFTSISNLKSTINNNYFQTQFSHPKQHTSRHRICFCTRTIPAYNQA